MTQKASEEGHKPNNILCIDCQENIQDCLEGRLCSKCSQALKAPSSQIVTSTLINEEQNKKLDALKPQNAFQDQDDMLQGMKRARPISENTKQSDPKRCGTCSKKTGILGYKCGHCCINYCKNHRLPEQHECQVDFVSLGRKKLKIQNPLVRSLKIQPI